MIASPDITQCTGGRFEVKVPHDLGQSQTQFEVGHGHAGAAPSTDEKWCKRFAGGPGRLFRIAWFVQIQPSTWIVDKRLRKVFLFLSVSCLVLGWL